MTTSPIGIDLEQSPDGSFHPAQHRISIHTCHNTDRYPLPVEVGQVLAVKLLTSAPRAFEFLEAPASRSYIHVLADGEVPTSPAQARSYLSRVYLKFHKPLWFRLEESLFLFPPPVNSGETISVDFEHKA